MSRDAKRELVFVAKFVGAAVVAGTVGGAILGLAFLIKAGELFERVEQELHSW